MFFCLLHPHHVKKASQQTAACQSRGCRQEVVSGYGGCSRGTIQADHGHLGVSSWALAAPRRRAGSSLAIDSWSGHPC